jgi:hypothetical protein
VSDDCRKTRNARLKAVGDIGVEDKNLITSDHSE